MKTSRTQRRKVPSWVIPLAYVVGTVVVGMVLPRVEHRLFPNSTSSMSAGAAMSICSAIASGMISLTGIVFSLAFVMVQFSATAYSPRLGLWLARDPIVAHALGAFTSTFLYALMLLAWVDRESLGRVPLVSGWLVLALLLASMGLFVALIERIGLLQVNRMLVFASDQGRKAIDETYPVNGPLSAGKDTDYGDLKLTQTVTHAGRPQVIQAINLPSLVQLATQAGAVIEVTAAVGNTVVERTPLLQVYGSSHPLDEHILRDAVEIGADRTFEQDPKYAIRLVVDIAIKALSAAINDPTTAVQALDQIEDLLLRLGSRSLDIGHSHDRSGALRLVVPVPSWEDFLRLGLDEIRFYGASSVQVMRRMKALINNLVAVLPVQRHAALRHWEHRLEDTIGRSFADPEEKQDASVADRQGLGVGEERTA